MVYILKVFNEPEDAREKISEDHSGSMANLIFDRSRMMLKNAKVTILYRCCSSMAPAFEGYKFDVVEYINFTPTKRMFEYVLNRRMNLEQVEGKIFNRTE